MSLGASDEVLEPGEEAVLPRRDLLLFFISLSTSLFPRIGILLNESIISIFDGFMGFEVVCEGLEGDQELRPDRATKGVVEDKPVSRRLGRLHRR